MIYWCRKQQNSFSCNIRKCEQGLTREREQLITAGSWYNGSDFYMNPIWNKKELKLFGIIPRLVDHKNNIMWNYLYLCNKDLQCDHILPTQQEGPRNPNIHWIDTQLVFIQNLLVLKLLSEKILVNLYIQFHRHILPWSWLLCDLDPIKDSFWIRH